MTTDRKSAAPLPPPRGRGLPGVVLVGIGAMGDYLPVREVAGILRSAGYPAVIVGKPQMEQDARRHGFDFVCFAPVYSKQHRTEINELKWKFQGRQITDFLRRFHNAQRLYAHAEELYSLLTELRRLGWVLSVGADWTAGLQEFADAHPGCVCNLVLTPETIPLGYKRPKSSEPDTAWRRALQSARRGLSDLLYYATVGRHRNRFRRVVGLRRKFQFRTTWRTSYQKTLALFPRWFDPTTPDWIEQVGFFAPKDPESNPAPEEILAFLDRAPTVLFSCGSHAAQSSDFLELARNYSRQTGRQILLLGGATDRQPAATDLVREVAYLPLREILPRCSAIVHRGGIGTTILAILESTPQLIHPLMFDQWGHAHIVTELGVGLSLPPGQWTIGELCSALKRLESDAAFRDNAASLARLEQDAAPRERILKFIKEAAAVAQTG